MSDFSAASPVDKNTNERMADRPLTAEGELDATDLTGTVTAIDDTALEPTGPPAIDDV